MSAHGQEEEEAESSVNKKKKFFWEVGRGEGGGGGVGLLVNLGGKEYNLLSSDTREDRHLFITWPYRMSSVGVNEVLMW